MGASTSPVFEDPLDVALVGGRDPVYLGGESIVWFCFQPLGSDFCQPNCLETILPLRQPRGEEIIVPEFLSVATHVCSDS